MTTAEIEWEGEKPSDAAEWERVIHEHANLLLGVGSVRIRKTPHGWLIEAARKTPQPAGPPGKPPKEPEAVDFRWHITEALKEAGKAVIGVDQHSGGAPLSPEREMAIRSTVAELERSSVPTTGASRFDVQVVEDLLGEVDRLRAKLQLAAHARDLAGDAGRKLLDACADIVPRAVQGRRGPAKSAPK